MGVERTEGVFGAFCGSCCLSETKKTGLPRGRSTSAQAEEPRGTVFSFGLKSPLLAPVEAKSEMNEKGSAEGLGRFSQTVDGRCVCVCFFLFCSKARNQLGSKQRDLHLGHLKSLDPSSPDKGVSSNCFQGNLFPVRSSDPKAMLKKSLDGAAD